MTTEAKPNHAITNATGWLESIHEMTAKLNAANEEDDSDAQDEARQEIEQSALSVAVRSGWYSPGAKEDAAPEEFEILLSTGGPALRIIGELDSYGQPSYPKLQWQDWGTPWTDYETTTQDDEALDEFCRCYWFGEG